MTAMMIEMTDRRIGRRLNVFGGLLTRLLDGQLDCQLDRSIKNDFAHNQTRRRGPHHFHVYTAAQLWYKPPRLERLFAALIIFHAKLGYCMYLSAGAQKA